ncbi:MAG: class I tRNA ligase family protein, partial [Bacteroidales bacterium]|nr:class I tRNA ligase family protein [Candidatus Colimorpha onthohippi]
KVGHSERTDAVIEPKLSAQWFMKMEDVAKKALSVVEDDTIQFHPAKFKNTYRHWLENIKDWCISRQLWWGQRIPAYYFTIDGRTEVVVAENDDAALQKARLQYPDARLAAGDLRQDEDVLDTWFSSWLWPIALFDGIRNPDNEEINYYYPTDTLITAPDIIFFWVARMIMAGEEYRNEIPFKHVYFTGIVRDKLGRKMSKSLGNSPDPIKLIEQYGADGVRMGMLLTAPAGNDLPFDESICEQGRNFANKIWNALRLVKGWQVDATAPQPADCALSVEWMEHRMLQVLAQIDHDFQSFRLSEALMAAYKLVWDNFCSWYLEMIKPAFGTAIDGATYESTLSIFERLMCMLHPFMPFVTEEIWHALRDRTEEESIMNQPLPAVKPFNQQLLDDCAMAQEIIAGVRNLRGSKGLSPKEQLQLFVRGTAPQHFFGLICKMANVSQVECVADKVDGALNFLVGTTECFVPMSQHIDKEAELVKLNDELKYAENFLASVMKKLNNEKFVSGAPEHVVNLERKKKSDAESKIAALKAQIEAIK